MKTWHWIAIGIIVILIIVYAVYAYNKNQERKRLEAINNSTNPGSVTPSGSSKFAEFLTALFPFYKEYQTKNP